MDLSKRRVKTAWAAPAFCEYLRAFWQVPWSGNQKTACFYGWAGVPGAQSAVFSRAAEAREFQKLTFQILCKFTGSTPSDAALLR